MLAAAGRACKPILGSTGCQPVIVGSLPTIRSIQAQQAMNVHKLLGRLPKSTGWQPVLPRRVCALVDLRRVCDEIADAEGKGQIRNRKYSRRYRIG
jgi:hypothetical protein